MKLEMRGRDLRAALEHGLAQTDRVGGGFLQVSGMRLVWDRQLSPGQRLVSASVGSRPLDDNAVYTVAVPSYLVRGGDGYTAFKAAKIVIDETSGPQVAQTILDGIVARRTIAPATEGRITTGSR
jgi:5'-nucleotidase / UDP-sugar diphosphatase